MDLASAVFTFALIGQGGVASQISDPEYNLASKTALSGVYKYSGSEAEVNKTFKIFEQRYIPKIVKKYGVITGYAAQIILEQKITFKMEF